MTNPENPQSPINIELALEQAVKEEIDLDSELEQLYSKFESLQIEIVSDDLTNQRRIELNSELLNTQAEINSLKAKLEDLRVGIGAMRAEISGKRLLGKN